jgi:hypothetical protein
MSNFAPGRRIALTLALATDIVLWYSELQLADVEYVI